MSRRDKVSAGRAHEKWPRLRHVFKREIDIVGIALARVAAQLFTTFPRLPALAAVALALTVAGCGAAAANKSDSELLAVFATDLDGDFRFMPNALHVELGETVVWIQTGGLHDVVSYHTENDTPVRMPEGAIPWHTGFFGIETKELTFRYTPEKEGVYDYFCKPHAFFGMVGRLVVGDVEVSRVYDGDLEPRYGHVDFTPIEAIMGASAAVYRWEAMLNSPIALFLGEGLEKEAKRRMTQLVRQFENGEGEAAQLTALFEEHDLMAEFSSKLQVYAGAVDATIRRG